MRTLCLLMIASLAVPALAANPPDAVPTSAVSDPASPAWDIPLTPPHLVDQIWPLPFGGRMSWATTLAPNPDPRHAHARVFLLRGTGVVFSPEFGSLCTRLRQAGVWAEDLRSVGDHWLCERLIAEHRAGRLRGPIVLVGHSRGGRHVLDAARTLQTAGVTVDLIVCLDVALPPTVPGNVIQAINLYLSGPRLYPAGTLVSAPGSKAQIENLDLKGPLSPVAAHGLHHLNITASPAVQELVVERILQVARAAPSW
jgi:pimeloyl-ACP methyl ester carboxylesterase